MILATKKQKVSSLGFRKHHNLKASLIGIAAGILTAPFFWHMIENSPIIIFKLGKAVRRIIVEKGIAGGQYGNKKCYLRQSEFSAFSSEPVEIVRGA